MSLRRGWVLRVLYCSVHHYHYRYSTRAHRAPIYVHISLYVHRQFACLWVVVAVKFSSTIMVAVLVSFAGNEGIACALEQVQPARGGHVEFLAKDGAATVEEEDYCHDNEKAAIDPRSSWGSPCPGIGRLSQPGPGRLGSALGSGPHRG